MFGAYLIVVGTFALVAAYVWLVVRMLDNVERRDLAGTKTTKN